MKSDSPQKIMLKIDIEKANISDAKRILDIQKAAYISEAEIYGDYQIPPLTQTLAEIEADFGSHTFYVAKQDGEIVGSVNIRIEGATGLIGRLIVAPDMQKRGIGTMLMDHVEASYAELEAFELFTGHKSEHNLAFYRKRGYLEFKRQPVHDKLAFIFMRKETFE